jgi:hypothetical protein
VLWFRAVLPEAGGYDVLAWASLGVAALARELGADALGPAVPASGEAFPQVALLTPPALWRRLGPKPLRCSGASREKAAVVRCEAWRKTADSPRRSHKP